MPVGATIGSDHLSNILTNLAVNFRNLAQQAANLSIEINGQGTGLAVLQSLGYSNTPNAANPGGISDAAWALQLVNYFSNVAGVWFGTATQASTFNYNNASAPLWAGQIT
jgi:hypothetical protein